MQFCESHWGKLRAKVAATDMAGLVAEGGEAAHRNFTEAITQGESINNFDPLMRAFMAVMMNALALGGIGVMAMEGCPICVFNSEHENTCEGPPCKLPRKGAYEAWLDFAVEDAQEAYQRLLGEATPQA